MNAVETDVVSSGQSNRVTSNQDGASMESGSVSSTDGQVRSSSTRSSSSHTFYPKSSGTASTSSGDGDESNSVSSGHTSSGVSGEISQSSNSVSNTSDNPTNASYSTEHSGNESEGSTDSASSASGSPVPESINAVAATSSEPEESVDQKKGKKSKAAVSPAQPPKRFEILKRKRGFLGIGSGWTRMFATYEVKTLKIYKKENSSVPGLVIEIPKSRIMVVPKSGGDVVVITTGSKKTKWRGVAILGLVDRLIADALPSNAPGKGVSGAAVPIAPSQSDSKSSPATEGRRSDPQEPSKSVNDGLSTSVSGHSSASVSRSSGEYDSSDSASVSVESGSVKAGDAPSQVAVVQPHSMGDGGSESKSHETWLSDRTASSSGNGVSVASDSSSGGRKPGAGNHERRSQGSDASVSGESDSSDEDGDTSGDSGSGKVRMTESSSYSDNPTSS